MTQPYIQSGILQDCLQLLPKKNIIDKSCITTNYYILYK